MKPSRDERKSGARRADEWRRLPDTVADFARDLQDGLARHLSAEVSFRGSFAEGTYDQYSDVDLRADVHQELDKQFFSELERFLTGLYGSGASIWTSSPTPTWVRSILFPFRSGRSERRR